MLRNDTIYLLDKDQDLRVPTTDVAKKQIAMRKGRIYGSVRLALGKVVGRDDDIREKENNR